MLYSIPALVATLQGPPFILLVIAGNILPEYIYAVSPSERIDCSIDLRFGLHKKSKRPVVVVWLTIILATSGNGEIYDGYSPFLDSEVDENEPPVQLGEAAMVSRDDQGFECPSPNVITTRYRCKVMWFAKYYRRVARNKNIV